MEDILSMELEELNAKVESLEKEINSERRHFYSRIDKSDKRIEELEKSEKLSNWNKENGSNFARIRELEVTIQKGLDRINKLENIIKELGLR